MILTPLAALLLAGAATHPAAAQDGRPEPQQPQSQVGTGAANARTETQPVLAQTPPNNGGPLRPRPVPEGKVTLAFNDVAVDEKITACPPSRPRRSRS